MRGAAAAAFALLCGAAAACSKTPERSAAPPARVVRVDFEGLERELASGAALSTVVDFWATWCAPCVAELPDLLAAAKPWRQRSVRLVLVSYDLMVAGAREHRDELVARVEAFSKAHGFDVDVLIYDDDPERLDQRFGLSGPIPETVALNKDGKVTARHPGPATRGEFDLLFAIAAGATEPERPAK